VRGEITVKENELFAFTITAFQQPRIIYANEIDPIRIQITAHWFGIEHNETRGQEWVKKIETDVSFQHPNQCTVGCTQGKRGIAERTYLRYTAAEHQFPTLTNL